MERVARRLPPHGAIIQYPYVWAAQRDAGETEGHKPRPVCVVLRLPDPTKDIHHLVLLAITSQPPRTGQRALEIPDTERRRAGLMRYPRAWIVVSESNYDIAEPSWYVRAGCAAAWFTERRFLARGRSGAADGADKRCPG